jgi:hypothetical protein
MRMGLDLHGYMCRISRMLRRCQAEKGVAGAEREARRGE